MVADIRSIADHLICLCHLKLFSLSLFLKIGHCCFSPLYFLVTPLITIDHRILFIIAFVQEFIHRHVFVFVVGSCSLNQDWLLLLLSFDLFIFLAAVAG